ncbi:MAG: helix-turn-helix transcriptional regulator, partial [Candidatus Humimicrobiaceae bacterium]
VELLNNPTVREEYNKLQPEYEIISKLIEIRIRKNLTQKELAELLGTKQSSVSRIENGGYIPSMKLIRRIAEILDCELKLELVPKSA